MMGSSYTGIAEIFQRSKEIKWTKCFAWLPKRSSKSGKLIWFKTYWYGTRLVWGPAGESPVRVNQCLTDQEYLWYNLTKKDQ